jgi:hypothetical protein
MVEYLGSENSTARKPQLLPVPKRKQSSLHDRSRSDQLSIFKKKKNATDSSLLLVIKSQTLLFTTQPNCENLYVKIMTKMSGTCSRSQVQWLWNDHLLRQPVVMANILSPGNPKSLWVNRRLRESEEIHGNVRPVNRAALNVKYKWERFTKRQF